MANGQPYMPAWSCLPLTTSHSLGFSSWELKEVYFVSPRKDGRVIGVANL